MESHFDTQKFFDELLTYDPGTRTAYLGRHHTPLTRDEFYQRLERPDLLQQYHSREHTQTLYYLSGGALAAAGIGAGLWFSLAPPSGLNANNQAILTASFLTVGLVGAGLLVGLGARTDLDPVSSEELQSLANGHNAEVRHRLNGGNPPPPVSWSWSRLQLSWQ